MRKLQWIVMTAAMAVACGEEKPGSGLVLVLDSDLSIPDSVDEVGLYVEHVVGDRHTLILAQEAKPLYDPEAKRFTLPFTQTFTIEAGLDTKNDRIRARFVAYGHDGTAVGMREARSAVPSADARQLRLPIRFVNEGRVQDTLNTGPVPTGAGVSLRQLAPGTRADPFGRFRHPECGEDQTLGDAGECIGIDVDIEKLPTGIEVVPSESCFDTIGCFSNQSEAGVRELPLGAGCTISVPPRTGENLAIAVPAAGYPTGHDAIPSVQPLDAGLYARAGATLTLVPPLCKRLQDAGVSTVLVSARCGPRLLDAPICAEWQATTTKQPTTDDRFLDEVDDGDASTDGDAADPGPDGDAGDAEPDGDGGPDGGSAQAFVRAFSLTQATDRSIVSFAAAPDGEMWILFEGSESRLVRVPSSPAIPNQVLDTTGLASKHVELGVDRSLYILPGAAIGAAYPRVLVRGAAELATLKFQNGGVCTDRATGSDKVTVGTFSGRTVALYGPMASGSFTWNGGAVLPADPTCFGTGTALQLQNTFLERGTELGGTWYVPDGHSASFATLSPFPGTAPFATFNHPQTNNPIAMQSSIAVANDHAIVIGRALGSTTGSFDLAYFRVTKAGASLQGTPIIWTTGRWASRETFGAQGRVCTRILSQVAAAERFWGVECVVRTPLDTYEAFNTGPTSVPADLHLFGDATYLYVAKLCHGGGVSTGVRLVAKPWAEVNGPEDLEGIDENCASRAP